MHSRANTPDITVKPGEECIVETEMNTGDWLHTLDDRWTLDDPRKNAGPNPTVCIGIDGAKPGDMLAVHIHEIQVDKLGYTGHDLRSFPLPGLIEPNADWGVATRTMRIEDGFIHWSDKLKLPTRPMIGTLGTAPETESLSNSKAGNYGGNMDVQEVMAGNTVYLPVFVDGAILHVGDVHALQGDGEINLAGGIECRSEVRLTVDVRPRPACMKWVRIENDDYIMTVCCDRSLEESFYQATREMLDWMMEDYSFTREEGYLLMGQLLESRCTQFVDPTRSYICKMPKKYLLAERAGGAAGP